METCRRMFKTLDLAVLFIIIVVVNRCLIHGEINQDLMFNPGALADGHWQGILLHPFVHVGWYHLILDAGAFLLLYQSLDMHNPLKKLACAVISGGAGLCAALASPIVMNAGLCGLSGTAHGLMAVSGLEMMKNSRDRNIGIILLAILIVKTCIEVATGRVMFEFLHFGYYGAPIVATHLGGVLGGILAFAIFSWGRRAPVQQ